MPSGTPESGFSVARGARRVGGIGGGERMLGRLDREGVERPPLDRRDEGLGDLARGEVAARDAVADRATPRSVRSVIGRHSSESGIPLRDWNPGSRFAE